MDEAQAGELKQYLMQSQTRPEQNGQQKQGASAPQSSVSDANVGVPRAMQGGQV
jgi:hypothetical protein